MLTKRKATKKSLDELRKVMPVLSENEQRERIGGNDCWWRVMAYLKSGGTNYAGPWDSWHAARYFLGYAFNPQDIAFRGSGTATNNCFRDFVATHSGSFQASGQQVNGILIFNPNQTQNWPGVAGMSHAVIIRDTGFCSASGAYFFVYCPQTRKSGQVFSEGLTSCSGNFVVPIRGL